MDGMTITMVRAGIVTVMMITMIMRTMMVMMMMIMIVITGNIINEDATPYIAIENALLMMTVLVPIAVIRLTTSMTITLLSPLVVMGSVQHNRLCLMAYG